MVMLSVSRPVSVQWAIVTSGLALGELLVQLRLHTVLQLGSPAIQDSWWMALIAVRLGSVFVKWIETIRYTESKRT
ncbi:hypothetical protein [Paenibacillus sp. 481]|uniref:hypothetical protein n=1 Tax=Paenibacillus sp. 481 TaxID=2835869 RepID=UPI001E40440B|nr:hypothetical protein [Paenibacillus sp. 481]UHA72946.1 hypothetical protein KIK04_20400 [Paenibacillus sp. 481]